MMDDHDGCKSDEVVKTEYVVHHRRRMAAGVPQYHSLWLHLRNYIHAILFMTYQLAAAPRSVRDYSADLRR